MADSDTEPLMPKISLSWLIGLVTLCAIAMGIIQRAVSTGSTWSIMVTIIIASALVPFLWYAGTFALAMLFSSIGSAAAGEDAPQAIYTPTTQMPPTQIPSDHAE